MCTLGCGQPTCAVPHCRGSTRLGKTEAAAAGRRALELAVAGTGWVCAAALAKQQRAASKARNKSPSK
jgi:hypothetical protein